VRVLLADFIRSEIGGGHMVLARLANRFAGDPARGVTPVVFVSDMSGFSDRFLNEGVARISFRFPGSLRRVDRRSGPLAAFALLARLTPFLFSFTYRLTRLCVRERVDLIHANGMTMLALAVVPSLLSRTKLVFHMHDALLTEDEGGNMSRGGRNALLFLAGRFASAVIANSDFVRNAAVSADPRLAPVTVTIHNGVEETPPGPRRVRTRSDALKVLSFGRLVPEKGFAKGLEAVAILKDRHGIDVEYSILGVGPDSERLAGLAASLGISEKVRLPGFVDDVRNWIAEADVVLVPSLWQEPFGLTVIEAMACGRPVVATRVGGIPEIVTDGEDGFLIDPGNAADEAAARIASLAADPATGARMAARAAETVRKRFTMDVMAGQVAALYSSLVAESRSGPVRIRTLPG
jgi:glycosyltransferase involved in cell wall biosynthesis